MKRRHFLGAATASVLVPAALGQCAAAPAAWDYAFFDERFERSRLVASSWSASSRRIGVQGDITPWWRNGLDRVAHRHPLRLRGVTTDSFHFCLGVLLGEHTDLHREVSRLDRNLLLWTIHTTPRR
jgi:hypothetical protein